MHIVSDKFNDKPLIQRHRVIGEEASTANDGTHTHFYGIFHESIRLTGFFFIGSVWGLTRGAIRACARVISSNWDAWRAQDAAGKRMRLSIWSMHKEERVQESTMEGWCSMYRQKLGRDPSYFPSRCITRRTHALYIYRNRCIRCLLPIMVT